MFDATKGNQVIDNKVEEQSDEFAALFMDLSPRKRLVVMTKMTELMSNPDDLDSFASGNYAQNNAGQPAQALGAGPSAQVSNETEALDVLMKSPALSDGIKNALRRILNPNDPAIISVENDGTPSELVSARKERDDAKTAKKAAEEKLAEEKDENKSGSLAHQLKAAKAAQAAPAAPADMVAKAAVKPLVDELENLTSHLSAPLGAQVKGKKAVTDKVAELKAVVS